MMLFIAIALVFVGFTLMAGGGTDDPNEFSAPYKDTLILDTIQLGDQIRIDTVATQQVIPMPVIGYTDHDGIFSFRRITLAPIIVIAGYVLGIFAIMATPKP